ncbi:hypothetical protein KSS92_10090 [Pseudomonas atacamensis]|uniref:hypothetical protein n=1 Tax=Pseudomonas atacamensis TaxID=2565368 RepID=UPI001C3D98EF|nr:hypothetical protein [Pseudomonas atacamensis]QXH74823.1 hypothetical protein KSS92_10090 [Pseudomonas atacamensis]
MNASAPMAALLVTASLIGCSHSTNHSLSVPLAATPKNSGHIANTTLTGVGDQTSLDFYITGVPAGTLLPPRVYTFIYKGSCQKPGAVAYAMNDKVNTKSDAGANGWSFYRTAPVSISTLRSEQHSIVVRTAPEDGSVDIFCGDIAKNAHP